MHCCYCWKSGSMCLQLFKSAITGRKKLDFGGLLRATNLGMVLEHASSPGTSNDLMDPILQLKF